MTTDDAPSSCPSLITVASLSVQQIEDVTMVAGHIACLATRELCLTEERPVDVSYADAPPQAARPAVAINLNSAA
jgi:hypothetical protein